MNIETVCDDLSLPVRKHPHDAGADLRACTGEPIVICPHETVLVPTGVKVAIPEGFVGILAARSSLCVGGGLIMPNGVGVIDSGYTGEIMVPLHNPDLERCVSIADGARVAQLLVLPCALPAFERVDRLEDTERGEGGFGSTGGGGVDGVRRERVRRALARHRHDRDGVREAERARQRHAQRPRSCGENR